MSALEGPSDLPVLPGRGEELASPGPISGAAIEQAQLARTPSGLPFVGDLVWGEHFCQFYETAEDLRDCLIPYFKTGLDNNEKCLWVASEPFGKMEALAALRAAVANADAAIARGQIEVIDHTEWYLRQGPVSPEDLPRTWLGRVDEALAEGYRGLRVTGNTAFLEPSDWKSFMDYEETVHRCFHGHRIVALCSYPLNRADSAQVLEVIQSHGFAIVRRNGRWESTESAALAAAKNQLASANLHLERRVEVRTAGLQAALAERTRTEAKLRASEERYRRIFQTAAVSIWDEDFSVLKAALDALRTQGITDLSRYLDENPDFLARAIHLIRINDVNDATLRLFEATDKSELLSSLDRIFVPGTLNAFRQELLAVFEGRSYFQGEAPMRTLKGRPLSVAFSMSAAPDDSQLRSVLVSLMDITECKQAEEKAKLLAREVNHRANNLLTLIGAMMRQARAETIPEFIASMEGRINALARVQTRLARDQRDRTGLLKLIDEELAPFAKDISGRFRIVGPDVPLGPDAVQALAIIIHELATNAVKYGSLSIPAGRVAVEWAISAEQLTLSWTETGGPATTRPSRGGFGTLAISALSQQLEGTVSAEWRRDGLVCTLAIPVQSLGN